MLNRRAFLTGLAALAVPAPAFAARKELSGDCTFYVSPQGHDGNDGLSWKTAKKTINGAYSELQRNWDLRGFTPTIQCAPGKYDAVGIKGELLGMSEPPRIRGSVQRGACIIKGDSHAVYVDQARVLIEGFTITSPDGMGVVATNSGFIQYRDIEFGQCKIAHVAAEKGASTYALCLREDKTKASYYISGPAQCHLYINGGGRGFLTDTVTGNGIQFLAPLKFTAFANVIHGGNLTAHTNTWSGPEPEGPAIFVRWNSAAAFAAQLPGNQALNFVDASSTLV